CHASVAIPAPITETLIWYEVRQKRSPAGTVYTLTVALFACARCDIWSPWCAGRIPTHRASLSSRKDIAAMLPCTRAELIDQRARKLRIVSALLYRKKADYCLKLIG